MPNVTLLEIHTTWRWITLLVEIARGKNIVFPGVRESESERTVAVGTYWTLLHRRLFSVLRQSSVCLKVALYAENLFNLKSYRQIR